MRCLKVDRRGGIVCERFFQTRHANAPTIARFETGKTPFRVRRHQIVSIEHGKIEKLARYLHANSVLADVVRPSAAITVAIKSGARIAAAAF